jgi:signal transduction histidine kinase
MKLSKLGTERRLRLLVLAQATWMILVAILGAWWGRLLLKQASRIAELEVMTGATTNSAQIQWLKTQRMLSGESVSFFVLVLASTALLFSLYWRDLKRSRSIQAFFASVTHELRTPLTSIRLQAESIADISGDPAQKALIERLLEDTLRLESQVERTLELARVEGGGPVLLQTVQVKPWLDRAIHSWKSVYRDRVDFKTEFEDVSVSADPAALQVILKNLLENSIKHSKRIPVVVDVRAGNGFISFQDNGGGYAGNTRRLGELFFRGAGSQGSGVGLYLVQVLMRRMGGDAVFSNEGGFRVDLHFSGGPRV